MDCESDRASDKRRAMKILMVGLGEIGQRHTRNLRTLLGDTAEIIAYRVRRQTHVVTPTMSADHSRSVDAYSIKPYSSLPEALAQKPDIAFVCNPNNLHIPVALECVRSGCDLFIEKPLSDSLDGTQELINLAEARNRVVMVGYQLRFHPCLRKLMETVQSGA